MPFAPGALVRVISLHRDGEIVESGRGGRYRVRVGGVLISCREDDLRGPDDPSRRTKRHASGHGTATTGTLDVGRAERAGALHTLDLHGLTVEEALRAVEQRLDAALRGGLDHLDIIHGRGSGRIKVAVHKFLKEVGAVRHFAVTPDNPGVTRVRF